MKYPRTQHTAWSQGGSADDLRSASNLSHLCGRKLVMTEKMDGENTVMTCDSIHARSVDGYGKPWQTAITKMWKNRKDDIPAGMNICGENLYAVHSIEYDILPSPFMVFSVFYDGRVLSWVEVEMWAALLDFMTVPVLEYGYIEEFIDHPIPKKSTYGPVCEGYVFRDVDSFSVGEFNTHVYKTVRPDHVQTDEHWTKHWKKAKVKSYE